MLPLLSFNKFGTYADLIKKDGAAYYWPLNDTSGSNCIGAIGNTNLTYTGSYTLNQNGPLLKDKPSGVLFSGGYIAGSTSFTNMDSMSKTIEAWIYPTSLNQYGIVDKDFDGGSSNYGGYGFWLQSTGQLWWWTKGGQDIKDNGSASCSVGAWNHVAVIWDTVACNAQFVINGVLNSSLTNTLSVEQGSQSSEFTIGSYRGGTGTFLGSIAHVAMYQSKLSISQLQLHYQCGQYGW